MIPASKLWWPLLWRLVVIWLLVVAGIDQAAPCAVRRGVVRLRPDLIFWLGCARFAVMAVVLLVLRALPGRWPARAVWGSRLGLAGVQWRALYGELALVFALLTLIDYGAWRALGFAAWVNFSTLVFPVVFAGAVMIVSQRTVRGAPVTN